MAFNSADVSIHGVLLKLVSRRPISKVFTSNRNYLSGEIDDVVKKAIHFVPVHTMEEVLEQALVQLPGSVKKRGYHAAAAEHKEASSAVLCR